MISHSNNGFTRLGASALFVAFLLVGCASKQSSVQSSTAVVEPDTSAAATDMQVVQPVEAQAQAELEPEAIANLLSAEPEGLVIDPAAEGEQVATRVQQPEVAKADVIWIQQRLKELGYYEGSIDGSAGQATRSAIKEYQVDQDIPTDGRPSAELREFMWRNGG